MNVPLRSICVFCGSSLGNRPEYAEMAALFGSLLAQRGIRLVYGGGNVGLMGVLADAALAAGGRVIGVMPVAVLPREIAHQGLTEFHEVPTFAERIARFHALSDAFIAMPGGIGTMEEMMVAWTMNQLAEVDKPVGLLNVSDFYRPCLGFIDHMVACKFLPAEHRHSICVDGDPAVLIDQLRHFVPSTVPKWL